MAVLRARGSDTQFFPPARCLVGRSAGVCDLVLTARDISKEHAVLSWTGVAWELHDLGSRNGTYVDSKRLAAGGRTALPVGARVGFGRESPEWELADASEPPLMALNLSSRESRLADGGYLVLPDPQHPEVSIYQDVAGHWFAERDGEPEAITDRDVLPAGDGALWRIYLPTSSAGTWQSDETAPLVANLRLRFAFTRDEEHVELLAHCGEKRLDLQARAHHYMLLLLARRRLVDQRAGVPELDQGWVWQDELLRMLKIDENHLNINIHRARTQLGRLGVTDAVALVERRPGARQLRLGARDLELAPIDPLAS